ncbi:hypothetical protein VTK56DRAFT_4834 [Thermocarpiscus australiensis]
MNSTVKRKFNALIQGISSRSSAGVSERDSDLDSNLAGPASSPASRRSSPYPSRTMATDSSLDLLNKRRRVGGLSSTPTKYGEFSNLAQSSPASARGTATISNVTLRKWTPGAASPTGAPEKNEALPPPKYCPGDREQLLRRLATFQELTDWTPKPDRVNEVEWAKRGWVCQGKERVKCTLCARELVVKVNRKEVEGKEIAVLIASEIAESVVDKYVELIVDAHAEDCLWRKKGCDDSLLRLPLTNPKLALQGLRQRYDELCERAAFLPYEFNLRLPPTLDLDTVISHLPPTFFTDPPPPPNKALSPSPVSDNNNHSSSKPQPPINRPALALALLGWQGLANPRLGLGAVPNSASCHTCLRRLGLWLFRSRAVDPDTRAVLVPAPMDHLDPLREHRFFCPWRNAAAQRNPRGGEVLQELAGWEVLCLVLRNEAFVREKVEGSGGKEKRRGGAGGTGAAHGRSKSSVPVGVGNGEGGVEAPERPATAGGRTMTLGDGSGGEGKEEETEENDEEVRRKKDLDMMARLRRVKSLFNAKAGSKLKRLGASRPGTSHSSVAGE